MPRLPYIVCFLLLCCGCRKGEDAVTSSYTFRNTTDKTITLDIYRERADYRLAQNRISQYNIPPGRTVMVPLEAIRTWYLDWYSAGYDYSNWFYNPDYKDPAPSPGFAFPVANVSDSVSITHPYDPDISRNALLGGNGTSATWKACDIYPAGTSTTPVSYKAITLWKDFTGSYVHDDIASGFRITDSITYTNRNKPAGGMTAVLIEMARADNKDGIGNLVMVDIPSDTMLATFYDTSYTTYYMKRQ